MSVIFLLILTSLAVAGGFLTLFIFATKSGQFEDTTTPSIRMLFDDQAKKKGKEVTSEEVN
ncbi:MAG: cbb3-type cytochrome oxidase assembly protein CcoS [Bacteroidota bacterium]